LGWKGKTGLKSSIHKLNRNTNLQSNVFASNTDSRQQNSCPWKEKRKQKPTNLALKTIRNRMLKTGGEREVKEEEKETANSSIKEERRRSLGSFR